MIDYRLKDLFWQSSVDHQLKLEFSGGDVITNEDIYSESMEITESLCSEQELHFGACESSQFKIRIANSFTSHIGQTVKVSMTLGGDTENPFVFGTYKVQSDKATADRRYRDITAYDAMYDILNADVSSWFNTVLPNVDSTVTLKEFRYAFFKHFNMEQEDVVLVNDDMTVAKTIGTEQDGTLSGKTIINAICEINGVFGHITRDNKFRYVSLTTIADNLYPSDDLYPSDEVFPSIPLHTTGYDTRWYKSCKYEDFLVAKIDRVQIRQEENDIGCIYPNIKSGNSYVIQGNFLVYGKSAKDLEVITSNIYNKINSISYIPSQISAIANPCIEVGDAISLGTKYQLVYSYMLQRSITGIQALSDSITANGSERYSTVSNGVNEQLIQLRGKANILERTVEENHAEVIDLVNGANSKIDQTAEEINLEVSKKVGNDEIISKINQSAEKVSINAGKIDLSGYVTINSLKSGGSTVVDGSRITTGSINCDRLNGGTISGQKITNGAVGSSEKFEVTSSGKIYLGQPILYKKLRMITSWDGTPKDIISSEDFDSGYSPKLLGEWYSETLNVNKLNPYILETDKNPASRTQTKIRIPDGLDGGLWMSATSLSLENAKYDPDEFYVQVKNMNNNVRLSSHDNAGVYHYGDTGFKNKGWLVALKQDGTLFNSYGSDMRLKNFKEYLDADKTYSLLKELKPFEYTYKSDWEFAEQNVSDGFSAQELRDLMIKLGIGYKSYLIINSNISDDTLCDLEADENDVTYGIDYAKLTPILWKGWQIHEEKMTELEAENQQLKDKVADLENKLNAVLEKIGGIE